MNLPQCGIPSRTLAIVCAIKTFFVNRDDIIFEKDLGPGTAKLAQDITKIQP
jgi:hypothetical protein